MEHFKLKDGRALNLADVHLCVSVGLIFHRVLRLGSYLREAKKKSSARDTLAKPERFCRIIRAWPEKAAQLCSP